jgi:chitodextrinase
MCVAAAWLAGLRLLTSCGEPAPRINQPPIAVLGRDLVVPPGVEVELSGAASTDPDGTIVRYQWAFGDGATAEGKAVRHAWREIGLYAVTLLVRDDLGAEGTAGLRVTVGDGGGNNRAPLAVLEGPGSGRAGEPLAFSGIGSSDPDGSLARFEWDFGDGERASGPEVTHAYAADGDYTVTLEVFDDGGALGRATRDVRIGESVGNRPPIAVAGADVRATVGEAVTFDGRQSRDPDGALVRWRWDFGDGGSADTPRATHAFSAPGTYSVTLTVEDAVGATQSDTLVAEVEAPPSYDGAWTLNPRDASKRCDNPRHPYLVAFPITALAVEGTADGSSDPVTGAVGGTAHVLEGRLDRSARPPQLTLAHRRMETEGACGSGLLRWDLSAALEDERTMSGRLTVRFDFAPPAEPFCNCVQTFDFTGARR